MTDHDIDAQLCKLFAEEPPVPDPAFSERIVALAAYDRAERRSRTRAFRRIAIETVGLTAVLATFAILARAAPTAVEFGDTLPLASPALLGLAMLVMWTIVGIRPAAAGR